MNQYKRCGNCIHAVPSPDQETLPLEQKLMMCMNSKRTMVSRKAVACNNFRHKEGKWTTQKIPT